MSYKVEKLTNEIVRNIESSGTYNYVKVTANDDPTKFCTLNQKFVDQYIDRIKNMDIYEDDIWIVTFAKTGTTWTQNMLWMINSDLDYETESKLPLVERFPYIEIGGVVNNLKIDNFEKCRDMPRPRYIKSHFPLFLLSDKLWTVKPKITYVARNPKDVAISYYHHYRHLQGLRSSREDFMKAFLTDQVLFAPYNSHVLEFWKIRNEPNIHFIFYEDMKRDLDKEVKRTAKFLGKTISQEQVDKLCDFLSVESMRKNPMCNYDDVLHALRSSIEGYEPLDEEFQFIRKGKVGSYKEELSEEEIQQLEAYANNPELKKFDFAYKY